MHLMNIMSLQQHYLITLCMPALNMAKSTVLHQNNKKININL